MAARSDLQNNQSNFGLFRVPQSNTLQKAVQNLFISSTHPNVNMEEVKIRNRHPSSEKIRGTVLLRLDSSGNELSSKVMVEYEKSLRNATHFSCLKRVPVSPTKSTILHNYDLCVEDAHNLQKLNAAVLNSFTASTMSLSTDLAGIHTDGILTGLTEDFRIEKDTRALSSSVNTNISVDQEKHMTSGTTECNCQISEQDLASEEVGCCWLKTTMGDKQKDCQKEESNVSDLAEYQMDSQDMDSGNFSSESGDDWEDVEDLDTTSACFRSYINGDGESNIINRLAAAKINSFEYAVASRGNHETLDQSFTRKDVYLSHNVCKRQPCLLRAASQKYIRRVFFMGLSCYLREFLSCRRRQEMSVKRKSSRSGKTKGLRKGSDSDEICSDDEDLDTEKHEAGQTMCPLKSRHSAPNQQQSNRRQFFCPLSYSDSEEEDIKDKDVKEEGIKDEDISFSGTSTTASAFYSTSTCPIMNFLESKCSLFSQKKIVQCSTEKLDDSCKPAGKRVSMSKVKILSADDEADKIAAAESRRRLAAANESWSKGYAADRTITPIDASTSNTDVTVCSGPVSIAIICKKVHFCKSGDMIMPILNDTLWAEEYASARVGPWIQMRLDRGRFQRRIAEAEAVISAVLTTDHRSKILFKLDALELQARKDISDCLSFPPNSDKATIFNC